MNQNVSPLAVVLVLLITLSIFAFKYWAHGHALSAGGANQMQHDRQGNLYITVADTLYQLSPNFKLLDSIELSKIGVNDLVGDFAFFSNGDILIRGGDYAPSFFDSLLAYLRLSGLKQRQGIAPTEQSLIRCDLTDFSCAPFGTGSSTTDSSKTGTSAKALPNFDSAHHIEIDWRTDTVYLSDTPQHTLYQINADGEVVAKARQHFMFPNHLAMIDDSLYVADTNRSRIKRINPSVDDFAQSIEEHRLVRSDYEPYRWVFSFARIAEEVPVHPGRQTGQKSDKIFWWVNHMDNNMAFGQVLIYDQDWNFVERLALPSMADPMDIRQHGDYVVISDFENVDLHVFKTDRSPVDFNWPIPLAEHLKRVKAEKQYYLKLENYSLYLFIILFAVGLIVALLQQKK